jgi:hypothetical protein
MYKLPRSGGAKLKKIVIVESGASDGGWAVQWAPRKKKSEEFPLAGCELHEGQDAGLFAKKKKFRTRFADAAELSFSLVGAKRSLDLVCESADDYAAFIARLKTVLQA